MPVEVGDRHAAPGGLVQEPAEPDRPEGVAAAGLEVVPHADGGIVEGLPEGGEHLLLQRIRLGARVRRCARVPRRQAQPAAVDFSRGQERQLVDRDEAGRRGLWRQPGSDVGAQLAVEVRGLRALRPRDGVRHQLRLPPVAGLRRDAGPADQRVRLDDLLDPRRLHPRAADLEAAVAAPKDLQLAAGVEHPQVARVEDARRAEAPVGRRQIHIEKAVALFAAGTVTGAGQGTAAHQDPPRAAHGHEAGGIVRLAEVDLGEVRHHAAGDLLPRPQLAPGDIVALRRRVEIADPHRRQLLPGALHHRRRGDLAAQDQQTQAPQGLHPFPAVETGSQQTRRHHDPRDPEADDGGSQGERVPHGLVADQHHRDATAQGRHHVPDPEDVAAHHVPRRVEGPEPAAPSVGEHGPRMIGGHHPGDARAGAGGEGEVRRAPRARVGEGDAGGPGRRVRLVLDPDPGYPFRQ